MGQRPREQEAGPDPRDVGEQVERVGRAGDRQYGLGPLDRRAVAGQGTRQPQGHPPGEQPGAGEDREDRYVGELVAALERRRGGRARAQEQHEARSEGEHERTDAAHPRSGHAVSVSAGLDRGRSRKAPPGYPTDATPQ